MTDNGKKNTSPTVGHKNPTDGTPILKGIEEKAQYEVFKNGGLPQDTIDKWIKNDLSAIQSFVHGILTDESIFRALSDAYYARYRALHNSKEVSDDKSE